MTHKSISHHLENIREILELRAVSGMAYPRAKDSLDALTGILSTVYLTATALLLNNAPRQMTLGELRKIARLTAFHSIEELIERSSLGTPEAIAARATVDPKLVQRVVERSEAIRLLLCPACKAIHIECDVDFCDPCLNNGCAAAYRRGREDAA